MSAKLCFVILGEEWFRYPAKRKNDSRWMVGKYCCILANYPKDTLEIKNPANGLYSMMARINENQLRHPSFYLQFLDGTVIPCDLSLSANVYPYPHLSRMEAFKQELLDKADTLAGGGIESAVAKGMVEQVWSNLISVKPAPQYKSITGTTYNFLPDEDC